MLPTARDPRFQTENISILMQHVVWNCVKMSMILLFYYVEAPVFFRRNMIQFLNICGVSLQNVRV